MDNAEKLYRTFAKALQIDAARVNDTLAYDTVPEWDSVAHMALIIELEDVFDVMLDTDDIIDMDSVGKAKQILTKYHVSF